MSYWALGRLRSLPNDARRWLSDVGGRLGFAASLMFHGPFDTSCAQGRSQERLRRIALTAVSAAAARAAALGAPLVTIAFTLPYLGKEAFGLWMTTVGLFSLAAFADLGLGNGLLTSLSRVATSADDCHERVQLLSSAFFTLLLVAAILICGFWVCLPVVPWGRLVNATTPHASSLATVVIVAVFVPRVAQIPFAIVERAQLAAQEGYQTNAWQCIGSLATMLLGVLAVELDLGPVVVLAALNAMPAVMFGINWCWYFCHHRPSLLPRVSAFSGPVARSLMTKGAAYCLLSVLVMFHRSVDNVIVAHVSGLEDVTSFAVAAKVSTILTTLFGAISLAMWSANGEALVRGDRTWVRKNTIRVSLLASVVVLLGGSALTLIGPWVMYQWLGPVGRVSRWLLLGFAAREVGFAFVTPFLMVLNGAGKVREQLVVYSAYAVVSLALRIALACMFGSATVPWSTAAVLWSFFIPAVYRLARKEYSV